MNGANPLSLDKDETICDGETGASSIEINFKRVATWTLIFTNVFFVSYFFAKLFQWI
jgi:hypothetical protein